VIESSAESTTRRTPWFSCLEPRPRSHIRLFCFPYAGGGAAIFRGWPALLPPEIEVWVVHLPGREQRISEVPHTSVPSLVAAICDEFAEDRDRRFAFFGHSMGALVAFEVVRRLRHLQLPGPECLVVSAHPAPHLVDLHEHLADLPDTAFIQAVRELNGTPLELFDDPELLDLVLPLLRADFKAIESYVYGAEEPLPCPIIAYTGTEDAEVPAEEVAPWQEHTTSRFRLRFFPGDHFFLQDETETLVPLIAQDVLDCSGPR
jgi:medium-chain acyl-[acyl-carrier-protein] hydrolase